MTFRPLIALTSLTASFALAAWTQEGAGSATFDAKGPAGFKIHGEAKKVAVADDGKALSVTIEVKDVDTDNSLRNKHMLEDMGAEQFPKIILSVPADALKSEDGKTIDAEVSGTFTIHGQSKKVAFKYSANCKAGSCAVEGSAPINLNDFGVKIRSYLGITVKPDIVVGARFSVKK
jgi:polyisoprenoid-binding protein YceI